MAIGRNAILGAPIKVERLEVPDWCENGSSELWIRRFSARSRMEIGQRYIGDKPSLDFYAAVFGYGVCDQSGAPLFTMPDDLPRLAELDGEIVQDVALAILKFNKLSRTSMEDAEKNLETTRSEGSPSA